jgi:hypothetical protein
VEVLMKLGVGVAVTALALGAAGLWTVMLVSVWAWVIEAWRDREWGHGLIFGLTAVAFSGLTLAGIAAGVDALSR